MFDFKSEESISILVATRLRVMSQHLCVGPPGCEETESLSFQQVVFQSTVVLEYYTRPMF